MSYIKFDIVSTESGDFKTTLNRSYRERKAWEPVNPKQILSFMPGTVVELRIKAGDKVKEGQTLLLFKAMKMNNNIKAPFDGTIKSVEAEVGVNIPKNTLMIEFE